MIRILTLDEIAEVTGGAVVDGPETAAISGEEAVTSVSSDTRTLQPGALFVALRGERFDGHLYLAEAATRGATAALVEDTRVVAHVAARTASRLPVVVVLDTLHALGDVARYVRDAFPGPVIAVTGSVGKTTTKELIAQALETRFHVLKTSANLNNEIGVPQTIFSLQPSHTALVLEMGMRGRGQILRLAEIGAPNVGVITGIGLSHAELLGSREAIARAKSELFELLPENGLAVYPAADDFAGLLRSHFKGTNALSCGIETASDVTAESLVRTDDGWRFTVRSPWGSADALLPSPGRFNVLNALFAFAVAGHLGVNLERIASSLAQWMPPRMRMETIKTPSGLTILSDAYNAAPDSMAGALQTLAETPVVDGGRRIAALGEMRELGAFAVDGHRSVGRFASSVDLLVLVGEMAAHIGDGARDAGLCESAVVSFATSADAASWLAGQVKASDVVLVKGSRATSMETVVEALAPSAEGASHG